MTQTVASYIIQRRPVPDSIPPVHSHPVIDRIYRAREIRISDELELGLKNLHHYRQLKDIDCATSLLVEAILNTKQVTIVGDFDADGATSTSVCMLALQAFGLATVNYIVPNRFDLGYGLSPALVDMAHAQGSQVLLTVDNGIACIDGVKRAKELGMTVIVTDHHLAAEQLPEADAIVNPNQPGCDFPSKNLAGVGVAFYLMLSLRAELVAREYFAQTGINVPNLATLLDIVAVGTVADVVPLDYNNRILVQQGLQRIRSGQCRPGISALLDVANRTAAGLTAQDLGFVIGPRLNAAGRLDDMALGIECLLADEPQQARAIATELDRLNQLRRTIEADMKEQAEAALASIDLSGLADNGLVIYRDSFHQGVIGIVAGRIKEQFQCPVIVFAQQDEQTLKGSARSVQGVHIRDVLERIQTTNPGIINKFGGHAMAAGLEIELVNLERFQRLFEAETGRILQTLGERNVIKTDGALSYEDFTLSLAQQIREAGPFGQNFAPPSFDGEFRVLDQRIVGQKHLKLVLGLLDGSEVDAIAFNVDTSVWPNPQINQVAAVYRLEVNRFRGIETLQLMLEHLEPK